MHSFQETLKAAIETDDVRSLYIACIGLGLNCQSVSIQLGPIVPGKFHEAIRDGLAVGQQWRAELEQTPWREAYHADWRPLSIKEIHDGR